MAHWTKFNNETHAKVFFMRRDQLNERRKRLKYVRVLQVALLVPDHQPTCKEMHEIAKIMKVSYRSVRRYVDELKKIGRCPCCGGWTIGRG